MAHPGGRPPMYTSPEQMQVAIDDYFDSLDDKAPTVTGLSYHLGFESREGLLYYEHAKSEFLRTIKRAKLRIEESLEQRLLGTGQATGTIFNLKNNFGWKDAQQLEHSGVDGGPMAITYVKDFDGI